MWLDTNGERVVVVGAGPAGCVVAARLVEAGIPTLLIEAGSDRRVIRPSGAAGLVDPDHHRAHYWSPLPEVREPVGVSIEAPPTYWMGKGLGGGSAVNGMLVTPGDRVDYDRWAMTEGCAGWSAEAMAPWLAKATKALDPESRRDEPDTVELIAAFDEGFRTIGLDHAGTTLDQDRCGILTPMLASRGGLRRTAADAYLRTADPNLSIRTGRSVTGLVEEDGSVKGVILAGGEKVAASTVVLAAGTVGTARLLHTTSTVRNVGGWIRNHAAVAIPFPWPSGAQAGRPPQVHRVARWSSGISGPAAIKQPYPDLSATLIGPFPGTIGDTGAVIVMVSSVLSSGHIELDGDVTRLVSNRLVALEDAARLRSGARTVLGVCRLLTELESGGVAEGIRRELVALDRLTDAELDDWIVRHPGPVYHAVGSCRMGARTAGAVTAAEQGRAGTVHGLAGVVVADASIFPDLVAGGLQLPVMAVAERIVAETLVYAG